MYLGKPATAIYLNNYTKKIKEKLYRMKEQETAQRDQQAESYTSTLSHEMRTPLFTIIFFLKTILETLS